MRGVVAVVIGRYKQINDWERLLKNIEKGESKIQRVEGMIQALDEKVKRYKNPWQELKVVYGQSKGKQAYTEEEDQFLVCATQKLGYGSWDELKLEIRKSWQFKFDWFLKSRTPQELNRRVDILIRLIEKENQEIEEEEREAKKAKKQKKSKKNDSDNEKDDKKSKKRDDKPVVTSISKRRKVQPQT